MDDSNSLPLHQCQIHKLWASLNKTYILLNFLALLAIFYYRGAFFFNKTNPRYYMVPTLLWLILFAAELVLSFLWVLKQSMSWRPVTRTVFPERLPRDEDRLPGIDVFICTADPEKEPTLEVMNTVISAMALDYPPQRLSVYLSDDGGAFVTLKGMKEAWVFATWWLPFCRRYNVKPIGPWAYFEEPEEESMSKEFLQDRKIVKEKYEIFKQRIMETKMRGEIEEDTKTHARNHSALIQVISENSIEDNGATVNPERNEMMMPLLVYVAREKRHSHPHNFKAGAINVLVRVSSTMSNSPYILILDCDMYCNDSSSARQAICFYLDPKLSPSLGWVQYPQKFHNINESDIYDSQMRTVWSVYWRGADGLQGPVISGTNFYIKRAALYGTDTDHGNSLKELRDFFGPSNDFIKSISEGHIQSRELTSVLHQEAEFLASCTYEKDTKWGKEVGFRYESVLEDAMTGFHLQSKGFRSVYLNPKRPQFLGSATTNLNEALTQGIRWYSGLLSIGLSKYCPLIYHPSKMQFLHKMFSTWIVFIPLEVFPGYCLATIPPLCLLFGIPIYPKVSNPLIIPFAIVFITSGLNQLIEVHISGGTLKTWLNEQRMGAIKAVTCCLYGTLDFLKTKLGLKEASFTPTNKATSDDKTKYYNMGKYDFTTSYMFLVPLVTLVTLNLVCFVGGVSRIIIIGCWTTWDEMFANVVLSFYLLVMSFPVVEGMLLRKDNGCVPSLVTFISMVVCFVFLIILYFFLH